MITLIALALNAVVVEMAATFWFAQRIRNAGVVDVVWAGGFAPLAGLIAAMASGDPGRRLWVASLVGAWSVRLGWHLYRRVAGHHPVEDVRYARLREEWGEKADQRMFGFFLLQGLLQVFLCAPVFLSAFDPNPRMGVWEWAGTLVCGVAIVGETIADGQLRRFREDGANRGRVCEVGLWRHSRHPNYFFEWLIWVGFALFAAGSPWGWLAAACPMVMLYFLLRVTGIPMTEELSVKSKGEAYRRYQRTTSAFVPWFRRKETTMKGGV